MPALTDQIDALLPQTQCQRCTYADCRTYAQAIARGDAQINQCPPGGDEVIAALAALLHRPVLALNPEHGVHRARHVAVIDETVCIGCARCIKACPVDAILGTFKLMHTVIADECTGCELCLPPCPVDCIVMQPAPIRTAAARQSHADRARARHRAREARLARLEDELHQRQRAKLAAAANARTGADAIKETVARALARKKPRATR
jgi:electron transport complex protein RnfB